MATEHLESPFESLAKCRFSGENHQSPGTCWKGNLARLAGNRNCRDGQRYIDLSALGQTRNGLLFTSDCCFARIIGTSGTNSWQTDLRSRWSNAGGRICRAEGLQDRPLVTCGARRLLPCDPYDVSAVRRMTHIEVLDGRTPLYWYRGGKLYSLTTQYVGRTVNDLVAYPPQTGLPPYKVLYSPAPPGRLGPPPPPTDFTLTQKVIQTLFCLVLCTHYTKVTMVTQT